MKPPHRFESGTMYWESSIITKSIIGKAYSKCKCPVFTNIQQTLHYNVALDKYNWRERLTKKVVAGWVALDRWSFYTVTIVWELAWVDSALVV